ncbi:hypothetical protein [Luteolibacter soli]|uniref:Uncharacterized protein n=1 Tax=Luteolibacter soli TaxID=3135280 RepID=A0ABU9AT63_9BACT
MNPVPAPSPNRDLLWLIFGALMLIAGIQLIPIRGEAREWLGKGSLLVAGIVFTARFVVFLLNYAASDLPAPLTDRTPKEPAPAKRDDSWP